MINELSCNPLSLLRCFPPKPSAVSHISHSHSIVLIECNELIYLHKMLFVLENSASRTVRCAWLLILKRNWTALELPRFQGLSKSTGQSSSNPLSVSRHRRGRKTTVSMSRTLIG